MWNKSHLFKEHIKSWYVNMNVYLKLDLRIGEPIQICIHRKDNSPWPVNYHLTLKEGPKVKCDHIKRFPAHDFLWVDFTLQTSRTNNKRVISTFNLGYPRLTLNEGPKVKSEHIKRFPAHEFLCVGLPSQTSRTNNNRVISSFKFGYPIGYDIPF